VKPFRAVLSVLPVRLSFSDSAVPIPPCCSWTLSEKAPPKPPPEIASPNAFSARFSGTRLRRKTPRPSKIIGCFRSPFPPPVAAPLVDRKGLCKRSASTRPPLFFLFQHPLPPLFHREIFSFIPSRDGQKLTFWNRLLCLPSSLSVFLFVDPSRWAKEDGGTFVIFSEQLCVQVFFSDTEVKSTWFMNWFL